MNSINKTSKWKLGCIALVLLVIAPVCLYWLVCTPNPWGWGFIKPEDTGAWLTFYGAVLGGFLTLGGVWWTIQKQDGIRKSDLAIRDEEKRRDLHQLYKPILDFTNPTIEVTDDYLIINFTIENVGRGEATNISFDVTNLDYLDKTLDNHNKLMFSRKTINILACNHFVNHKILITRSLWGLKQDMDYMLLLKASFRSVVKEMEMSIKIIIENEETDLGECTMVNTIAHFEDCRIKE